MAERDRSGRFSPGWFSWLLLIVRVAMGLFFLMEAEHQISSGYIGADDLGMKLQKAADESALPGYRSLLEHIFIQIDEPLTALVIVGEICVGIGLILGLFTRLTAAVAMFMNLNFLLMNGTSLGASAVDLVFIAGEALLFVYAGRQALSVDGGLAQRGFNARFMSA